ncbi:enoyl-CoA hydratase/isomerase family protein [bacterium]|nr:enoyl-CoA hydratase/isomerase family protein [bacterium]
MQFNQESLRQEVNRFRSSFQDEALDTAEKSLTLEKRGPVAIIWFDQHQEKANKLSTPNMLRLFELFVEIEKDKKLGALVILSKKPSIFIAGADIAEIQKMAAGEATVEDLMKLQSVFTYLERLSIPSIAAINGACMGGGTELTLACDYRIATDAPETKMALPEVMLGVLPGWGGTQRMPRLIGLESALDLILTGRNVDGKKAKKMGLVDKVVPKELLETRALEWAAELAKSPRKAKKEGHASLLSRVPGGKWMIFDQARKGVMSKTKGHYPAPLKIIEVLKKTYGGDLDAGLKVEAQAFTDLVRSPECKSLIGVFYLQERVKKDKGSATGIAKEVHSAGVLGAGVMGGGIAQLFAAKNVRVRMKDINWDAIAKGFQAAQKIFYKQVQRKKMRKNEFDNAMARIEGSTSYAGFKGLDLVVEAVVENIDVKKAVFGELEKNTKPDAILATNTSSLSVGLIATGTTDPTRVVGMHFFNPVDKMPLVEVIRGKETSEDAVATVFQFSKKLGKTPIVVQDGPGFVVNRILAPYLNEAGFLLSEGVPPRKIDDVIAGFGMPMGPCTLLDEVGLDVGVKVAKILYTAFGDRMKAPNIMEKAGQGNRYGKKTGKGIYLYPGGEQKNDPELFARLGVKENASAVPDDKIVKRCIYAMINEAARCVEDKLVRDVADIDIGMIFGTGFPPFRGGLLRYADSLGAEAIVGDLEVLQRMYGERFAPAPYLQQLAVSGKKFYEK